MQWVSRARLVESRHDRRQEDEPGLLGLWPMQEAAEPRPLPDGECFAPQLTPRQHAGGGRARGWRKGLRWSV
eukprot:jgi/Ulvmu1/12911/UM099_0001.1